MACDNPGIGDIVPASRQVVDRRAAFVPALIADAGDRAARRFIEFFTAHIRNANTRAAYGRAVREFCCWCADRAVGLAQVEPMLVAAYIEELQDSAAKPTVKQHLAAIRMLFDYLVTGQIVPVNPAASVRGPKHVTKKGKTPVLTAEDARILLDSIDVSKLAGLRDRAMIGVMVYSFARVGALTAMDVEDYYPQGRRMWFRLHEKGGKRHDVPAHHNAEQYVDAYLLASGIGSDKHSPLFPTLDRRRQLSDRRMHRNDVLAMIKRRALAASLAQNVCCHTFRATGITEYLRNGGTVEKAQQIAAHESPRTTQLYNRTDDDLTLDEIERIVI